MSELRARVAYLEGLMAGLDIDRETGEGRMLAAIVEVLGDVIGAVDEMDRGVELLTEYIDDIDDDLSGLESDFYEEEPEWVEPEEQPPA